MSDQTALDQFIAKLKAFLPDIQERYSIDTLGVFGSFVRGEQTSDSDLDLVVTFQTPQSLLDLVELENLLSDHLGVKVDLVTEAGLKSRVREAMVSRTGFRAGRRGSGMSGAALRAKLSAEQEGKREPEDFTRSRV